MNGLIYLCIMFRDRKLLVATQHGKEDAIGPVLRSSFNLDCYTVKDLNTDSLGTFTGEIERTTDALAAAREKCRMAMDRTGADLVVASEGSFGPHPGIYFIPGDDEILVLRDRANNIEIIAREISSETNFAGREVSGEDELIRFAEQALFPSHALIIRPTPTSSSGIIKGITDREQLLEAFKETLARHGSCHVETDMRAMFNPTRMKVIEKAARRLAEKMASCCPSCYTPGFSITAAVPGLPCSLCGTPTRSTLRYTYRCEKCGYSKDELFPKGKTTEDPMYCDLCNP